MATDDETADTPRPGRRTVTAPSRTHPDATMDVIGWLIFLGLLVLLSPLLPYIAAVWLFGRVRDALSQP
jgi:hypothetical protein